MRLDSIPCLGMLALLVTATPAAAASALQSVHITDPASSSVSVVAAVASPDTTLPPPGGTLPYVDRIEVCPYAGCFDPPRPICPDDSLRVLLAGNFPSDCYRLHRVDVLWPPPTLRVAAPRLRIVVDNNCCIDRLCRSALVPWRAFVTLPPMPPGPYDLTVMLAEVCCADSVPAGAPPTTRIPFAVADNCNGPPVPQACLFGTWLPPMIPERCAGYVAPGQPAKVTFALYSTVPLAGLQGAFTLSPPGLRIARIEPVGPAAGMLLRWTPAENGARFVLFADQGAPIPAKPRFSGDPVPVLALVAETAPGAPLAPATTVAAADLVGADAEGRGIPPCPFERIDFARICAEVSCDFNRDGFVDVRDLVMMVRCLRANTCAAQNGFDCDRDTDFDIDDVVCCAMRILRRGPCPDCPPDTTPPRKDRGIRFSVGAPVETEAGVDVPLVLEGAERVGAARLALRLPVDRYEVKLLELAASGIDWLHLTEVEGDELVIGLVQIGGMDAAGEPGPTRVEMTLHLALRPGQEPGGLLTAADCEFSGPDGARLEIGMSVPARPLAGGLDLALSENRPEPFSGGTRFTLTLSRAANVDVAVHDVTGRRVATIHRGPLTPGISEFRWNGRTAEGARAESGIYFYRAAAEGRAVSRRMVLLRGE
jgi:hypothetical protein